MRVVVTGAFGLLGRAFQDIITNNEVHAHDMEIVYMGRSNCDLRDRIDVMRFLGTIRPDVIVHLASHVGGVYDNVQHNYTYFMDNTKIHTNILEACREFGVSRLVNVLSTCIFPDEGVQYPLTSDQLHRGLPHFSNIGYAYSKRFLHIGSEILASEGITSVVNVIPTNLYGENDNYHLERAHVIPALIHKAYLAKKNGTKFQVRGSGMAVRQFLYAKDLARILFISMTKNFGTRAVTFIASPSSSEERTIAEVVELIRQEFDLDGERVAFESVHMDGQLRKTTTDTELRRHFPDFKFTPFAEGLGRVVHYFNDNYTSIRKNESMNESTVIRK